MLVVTEKAPTVEIEDVVRRTQDLMAKASEAVLGGFGLRTDTEIVRYPDRYQAGRGLKMWTTVCDLLTEIEAEGVR